jgi:hypothetical protein
MYHKLVKDVLDDILPSDLSNIVLVYVKEMEKGSRRSKHYQYGWVSDIRQYLF